MQITKEHLSRLKNAAKGAAIAGAGSLKTTAIAFAAGAAVGMANRFAREKVQALQPNNRFWIAPAVGVAAGHLLKKKAPSVGLAIVAASGAYAEAGFKFWRDQQAQAQQGGTAPAPAPQAQGFGDAGSVVRRAFAPARAAAGRADAGRMQSLPQPRGMGDAGGITSASRAPSLASRAHSRAAAG